MYNYGTFEAFLYTFNYYPQLLILITSLFTYSNEKLLKIIFNSFITFLILINTPAIIHIIDFASQGEPKHYSFFIWVLYSLITTAIFTLIFYIAKKLLNEKLFNKTTQEKYTIYLGIYVGIIIIFGIMNAIFHGRI